MPDLQGKISELSREAEAAIGAASDAAELEGLRVRYLGRKAELTGILRGIGELPAAERGPAGQAANAARQALEAQISERLAALEGEQLEEGLAAESIDVTLPGTPAVPVGARNLLIRTVREIEDVFVGLGYRVMEGPEVELDYYNFTALNHPPGHPARMAQDTFYVDAGTLDPNLRLAPAPTMPGSDADGPALPPGPEDVVLRTHTSPMQVRAMESQGPPIFIVVPGRCYRSDPFDATHSPIFHQVEGLAVSRVDHAGRPQGDPGRVRARDLRPGAANTFSPGLLPVHGAERRGRRLVLPLRWLWRARGRLARLDL